ncbi:MAG: twin-arginine translocase subunit TatC [Gammaproteobacteria bacterium]
MSDEDVETKEQGFISHLLELRDRLLRIVVAILVFFVLLFPFSEQIFSYFAQPLLELMPEGTSMIAIGVTSPFLVPFKLVLMLSVLMSLPFTLYQVWAFVAPGMYKHEKKLVAPLVFSSVMLFYCGIAFAYFAVFPLLFGFFIAIAPEGVSVMTDIGQYLDFILAIFFAFGIAFEMPVATFLLVQAGATTVESLSSKRPYIIVGVFVIGMLLTPPDIISQSLLAIPMWLLFEIGLIASRVVQNKKNQAEDEDEDDNYNPMSEEEMDAEMDRMDTEDEQKSD